MRRRPAALAALLLPAAASGCAAPPAGPPPLSAADYATMREALAVDPDARLLFERECRAGNATWRDPGAVRGLAVVLDVDEGEVPQVACERLVAAIARGDLGYADYLPLNADDRPPDTETMRRLFRALRRLPGQIES